jgi:hypothetical protein
MYKFKFTSNEDKSSHGGDCKFIYTESITLYFL